MQLNSICEDILALLDNHLIEKAEASEATVFYLKMKADYYRYLAEFAEGAPKEEHAGKAQKAYAEATVKSSELAPTHPIRLGLALNYSVFQYEVQGKNKEACELAKQVNHRPAHRHPLPPPPFPHPHLPPTLSHPIHPSTHPPPTPSITSL